MNRLLILDGNALLHRAYHALPPLTTSDGQPAGAVYGFVSMLLRLKTDLNSTHYAVAFDRPTPTFRKELFKEYQSQRPEMEDELVVQVKMIHDVLTAFRIPIFEMDGFEADDVIGTIIMKVKSSSFVPLSGTSADKERRGIDQIIIVTGDRDLLQLVEDEKVMVYMPVKGLTEAKLYGEKDVIERLGVPPKKVPDWKAFAGDSSDNYPGVSGIGPKTAADLVMKFRSVEKVYEAVEKNSAAISKGVQEKLLQGKESAMLGKTLATIRTDAAIEVNTERLACDTFDIEEAHRALQTLGFPSLEKRLSGKENKEIQEKPKRQKKKINSDSTEQLTLV